jgi:predicted membrane channel-forming protein YqfA (hemolysin III family)
MSKKSALFLFAMIWSVVAVSAQGTTGLDQELFEELHGHASFNVVFAVLLVILLGCLFYLWRLDRKVNKLLKEAKK